MRDPTQGRLADKADLLLSNLSYHPTMFDYQVPNPNQWRVRTMSCGGAWRRPRHADFPQSACVRFSHFLHPTARWGSVVNRANSLRTTAKVLHETLRGMEESPDVNPSELPFLKLKSTVLEQEVNLQEQAKAIETPPIEETTD